MPLPPDKERGWRKLSLFRDDVGLEGRVLFLDLDVVIVGNIDGFFTIDGDFIFIRHWKPSVKQGVGQTAVYRFEAGKLKFLYDDFIENMHPFPLNFFFEPRLPGKAKIIVFHGNPTPDQALSGKVKGIKKFIRFVKTPEWLRSNWR